MKIWLFTLLKEEENLYLAPKNEDDLETKEVLKNEEDLKNDDDDKMGTNSILAEPGALVHSLQCHTACKIQFGH